MPDVIKKPYWAKWWECTWRQYDRYEVFPPILRLQNYYIVLVLNIYLKKNIKSHKN